jgi:hypothetical protein
MRRESGLIHVGTNITMKVIKKGGNPMSFLNSIRGRKRILNGERLLSFFFGILFSALLFWSPRSPIPVHAMVPKPIEGSEFPAQKCLPFVSTWVVRNEVWYDYSLSEEARNEGYKIRAAQVDLDGNLVSIRVSK